MDACARPASAGMGLAVAVVGAGSVCGSGVVPRIASIASSRSGEKALSSFFRHVAPPGGQTARSGCVAQHDIFRPQAIGAFVGRSAHWRPKACNLLAGASLPRPTRALPAKRQGIGGAAACIVAPRP